MCACRQKKRSFLIKDILQDGREQVKRQPYRSLSREPTAPLSCSSAYSSPVVEAPPPPPPELAGYLAELPAPWRRHTLPLCPRALPAYWPAAAAAPRCCDPLLPLATAALQRAYSFDAVAGGAWYSGGGGAAGAGGGGGGGGARRCGGQVRFTAAQSAALERRFLAARYLPPDQRRRLARDLRLEDRQVKTWFQNRRAKWRRTTSDKRHDEDAPRDDTTRDGNTIRDSDASRDSNASPDSGSGAWRGVYKHHVTAVLC